MYLLFVFLPLPPFPLAFLRCISFEKGSTIIPTLILQELLAEENYAHVRWHRIAQPVPLTFPPPPPLLPRPASAINCIALRGVATASFLPGHLAVLAAGSGAASTCAGCTSDPGGSFVSHINGHPRFLYERLSLRRPFSRDACRPVASRCLYKNASRAAFTRTPLESPSVLSAAIRA